MTTSQRATLSVNLSSFEVAPNSFPRPKPSRQSQATPIYVDGSCVNNGLVNARAGYGVHFPGGEHPDASVKLPSSEASALHAELAAVQHALFVIANEIYVQKKFRYYVIFTDSTAAIDQILVQSRSGSSNGWAGPYGALLRKTVSAMNYINDQCTKQGVDWIRIGHVEAHSDNAGNQKAHNLARQAASWFDEHLNARVRAWDLLFLHH